MQCIPAVFVRGGLQYIYKYMDMQSGRGGGLSTHPPILASIFSWFVPKSEGEGED